MCDDLSNIRTLLFTYAGSMMLGEARRTLAGEPTDGVYTQELTVMLFG